MATKKQPEAAKRNIRKAQAARSERQRKEPGTGGGGAYYHIAVRPRKGFQMFRTQDVGEPGHVQRVAGKRASGNWGTVKWLISKDDAHVVNGRLIPETKEAKDVLAKLASKPVHVKGDRFEAKPRRDVPEAEKPTAAQRRAQRQNIKKAQAARRA